MTYTWTRAAGGGRSGAPELVAFSGAPPPRSSTGTPLEAAAAAVSPQAADGVAELRRLAGGILADLYRYLESNAVDHPALAPAIPALSDAVAEHRSGQAADPLAGARAVYATIQEARRADPALPEA